MGGVVNFIINPTPTIGVVLLDTTPIYYTSCYSSYPLPALTPHS